MPRKISDSTVRRLSQYLRILEGWGGGTGSTLSSEELADHAGTTAAQVRKDLSLFGSFGKRGTGYPAVALCTRIREILGLERTWRVALVGAGRIGAALFEYGDFRRRGFHIVAVFDQDPGKVGQVWGDVSVAHVDRLEEVLAGESVDVVILAVPGEPAQALADRAVAAGASGILNFAPRRLRLPPSVAVQNVNLVSELEALAFHLTHPDRVLADHGAPASR